MTQEFVTLPREVVEQAMSALEFSETQSHRHQYDVEASALSALSAALDQPQNHIPGVRNMVPTGWKLVPVEPTVEMMDAGGAATRRCYQHLNKDEVMCSYVYRHMLAAAPQPPALEQQVEKESTCKESLQAEQEPVAYGLFRKDSSEIEWDADHVFSNEPWGVMYDDEEVRPLYTSPHPKREPLTDEQIIRMVNQAGWDAVNLEDGFGERIRRYTEILEAAHNK